MIQPDTMGEVRRGEINCGGRPFATSLAMGVVVLLLATATVAVLLWDKGSDAYT